MASTSIESGTISKPTHDALIIGAGQGGSPLATHLASLGYRVALIERSHLGGCCINEGCTPTKTMVASARVAYLARRAAEYGVEHAGAGADAVKVKMEKVRERKRAIVESFRGGSERRATGVERLEVVMGEARFVGQKEVEVVPFVDGNKNAGTGEKRRFSAETIIVNVGCRPARLAVPGADEIHVLDSTSIMELGEVPRHLVVAGGGYIGLEFAQMFRRFGSEVTVVQRRGQLLDREDEDIAEAVLEILKEDGVKVMLDAEVVSLAKKGQNGVVEVVIATHAADSAQHTLTASHVLAAAGRVPNTDSLHAVDAGLDLDSRGYIKTNEYLETNIPGIYAIGDIKGGPAFTHISYDDFRILQTNVFNTPKINHNSKTAPSNVVSIKDRIDPYTVFIDPQLGRVGLSEKEARHLGLNIRVAKMPMSWVARALEMDESRGLMKAIVDKESGRILGATVLGIEGGEVMAMLQIAMMGGLTFDKLRDAVFAHPTLAESLNNLFGSFVDE